jgi:hypothetical protein
MRRASASRSAKLQTLVLVQFESWNGMTFDAIIPAHAGRCDGKRTRPMIVVDLWQCFARVSLL